MLNQTDFKARKNIFKHHLLSTVHCRDVVEILKYNNEKETSDVSR